ncbi:MAG: hypothetical protein AAGH64_12645 [Planctomycetota bacterium]
MEQTIKIRHARCAAIALAALSLGGCATNAQHADNAPATSPSAALVYASDAMLAWEDDRAPADADRFEFARNDPVLGAGQPVALRATDQWPEALRPIERPVVFGLFQQDRSGFGRFGGFGSDRTDRRFGGVYSGRYDGRFYGRSDGRFRSDRGSFRPDNGRSRRGR